MDDAATMLHRQRRCFQASKAVPYQATWARNRTEYKYPKSPELERGDKREYVVFERDNVDCGDVDPDGLESDDASTVIAATVGTAGDRNYDDMLWVSR
ncbi:hypothetical protein PG995_005399 [Apiospora arundinis]